jgi:ssDNA thymidine ADP-ribosyltransferase, DarT
MAAPAQPKIYHIAHVDRLAAIVASGGLHCDATMVKHPGGGTMIGMTDIKQRRLALPVDCHPGAYVGEFVPFYFCPRSVMLYLIYMANHPGLVYRGGQAPIVHLEADLNTAVQWAQNGGRRWAFTLSNAGAYYTQFRSDLADLAEVNWAAVGATDFRSAEVKEGKQAEFLMHGSFPWNLVTRIGVYSQVVAQQVADCLKSASHRPAIEIRRDWYY